MSISPLHHFRNNPADLTSLQDTISTLIEYSEYLVGAVGEISANANSTPADGMTLHLVANRDADQSTNAVMHEAVDEIIEAAIDLASLLNIAARAEVAGKLEALRDYSLTSNADSACLKKILAALHVPHTLTIQRNLFAAETTVQSSDSSFSTVTQTKALRTIARGEKAMTKESQLAAK